MKAAVLYAKDDLRIEEIPCPQVNAGEVLVRVKATGICGSDIPRVLGDGAHFYPIVLGHEFSGDIVEIGKEVISSKVGDRVAGIPLLPCMRCADCQMGNFSQCKNYSFIGSRIQGSFAEYVKVPAQNVIQIADNVSYEQGAFFEPASVALHGLKCVDYRAGEDVAILGGGTVGLFTAQWAKIYGAKRVFVFDIDEERLKLAKKLGADFALNTLDQDFRHLVAKLTDNQGFGCIFETAGSEATILLSFELAANGARVCQVGTPTKNITFLPSLYENISRKEFRLTGSWMSYSAPFPGDEWKLTAHFFASGQLKFDEDLIFKKLSLDHIKEGFDLFKKPGVVKGKIMLVME